MARIKGHMITANIESNRPNTEILFESINDDSLQKCREIKDLLQKVISGYVEDIEENYTKEQIKEHEDALETLQGEFEINIFYDEFMGGTDEKEYVPEITDIQILETYEVD